MLHNSQNIAGIEQFLGSARLQLAGFLPKFSRWPKIFWRISGRSPSNFTYKTFVWIHSMIAAGCLPPYSVLVPMFKPYFNWSRCRCNWRSFWQDVRENYQIINQLITDWPRPRPSPSSTIASLWFHICQLHLRRMWCAKIKLMAAICNVGGFVDQLNDSRAPFKPKAPSFAVVICTERGLKRTCDNLVIHRVNSNYELLFTCCSMLPAVEFAWSWHAHMIGLWARSSICIVVKFDVAPSSDRMGRFVCCYCLSMLTVGSCQWVLFCQWENMIDVMFLPRLLMFQHSAIVSPPSAIIFVASIGR
jgi:hypothetical protein